MPFQHFRPSNRRMSSRCIDLQLLLPRPFASTVCTDDGLGRRRAEHLLPIPDVPNGLWIISRQSRKSMAEIGKAVDKAVSALPRRATDALGGHVFEGSATGKDV